MQNAHVNQVFAGILSGFIEIPQTVKAAGDSASADIGSAIKPPMRNGITKAPRQTTERRETEPYSFAYAKVSWTLDD